MMRGIVVLVASLAMTGFIGCGSDDDDGGGGYTCEELCNVGQECPDASDEDCASSCAAFDTMNDTYGCTSEFDDYIQCIGGHQDEICDENSASCMTEMIAYADCIEAYCEANPDNC